ncbi:MAG: hypothetical protein AAF990_21300, partial [Bacteroidota bacterium]
ERVVSDLLSIGQNRDTVTILNKLLSEVDKKTKISSNKKYQIFDLIYEDLDGNRKKEILLHFGEMRFFTKVIVLKKLQNKWNCIFNEEFGHQYSGVVLKTLEVPDGQKIFYLNHLEERGSGIHKTAIYFFRIVQEEVIPALRILSTAYVNGWGLFINQEVNGEFKYNSDKDEIRVIYSYSFYPGPINKEDVSWESHPEVELFEGVQELTYKWDNLNKEYNPKDIDNRIKSKVKMFDDFGNDSLFIIAFESELSKLTKSEDPVKAKIVLDYFNKVRIESKVRTHNLQITKKQTEGNGLNFYGNEGSK